MTESAGTLAAPMEGGGRYNANSALQASGAALALPWIEDAARLVPAPEHGRPIFIADYGCSEGRNSVEPIRRAIVQLRARLGASAPIGVIHADLPNNDFSSLFGEVEGPSGYAGQHEATFPFAVGRSFFRQITPDAFVSLGWCSYAVQWLSASPGPVRGHIAPWRGDDAERAAFDEAGRRDWATFIALRTREMRPGARLILVVPALLEDGIHPAAPLFDVANDSLRALVARGALAEDEHRRMTIPVHLRTHRQMTAPFDPGEATGLRLIESRFAPLDDGSFARFASDGDARALAARRAGFFRATFAPSLAAAIVPTEIDRRAQFLSALEDEMRLRLEPMTTALEARVAALALQRRD